MRPALPDSTDARATTFGYDPPTTESNLLVLPDELLELVICHIWSTFILPGQFQRQALFMLPLRDRWTMSALAQTCKRLKALVDKHLDRFDSAWQISSSSALVQIQAPDRKKPALQLDGDAGAEGLESLCGWALHTHGWTDLLELTVHCPASGIAITQLGVAIDNLRFNELVLLEFTPTHVALIPSRRMDSISLQISSLRDRSPPGQAPVADWAANSRRVTFIDTSPRDATLWETVGSFRRIMQRVGHPEELVFERCRCATLTLSAILASSMVRSVKILRLDFVRVWTAAPIRVPLLALPALEEIQLGPISGFGLFNLSASLKRIHLQALALPDQFVDRR